MHNPPQHFPHTRSIENNHIGSNSESHPVNSGPECRCHLVPRNGYRFFGIPAKIFNPVAAGNDATWTNKLPLNGHQAAISKYAIAFRNWKLPHRAPARTVPARPEMLISIQVETNYCGRRRLMGLFAGWRMARFGGRRSLIWWDVGVIRVVIWRWNGSEMLIMEELWKRLAFERSFSHLPSVNQEICKICCYGSFLWFSKRFEIVTWNLEAKFQIGYDVAEILYFEFSNILVEYSLVSIRWSLELLYQSLSWCL